jgi:hypothetical protein
MVGISGSCTILFKTDGPSMLAGATPSRSSIRSYSRKYDHTGKARNFDPCMSGVASLAHFCAADLLASITSPEPLTSLQRPCAFSVIRNSPLHVRLLSHANTAMEFTGLALGRTL